MNQIIVDVGVFEDRVAVLEDNELVEFYVERYNGSKTVGNIYKGRVVNVLPGMQAAFVDIGLKKNSFLYVRDALPKEMLLNRDINLKEISICDVLKQGQEIIVQVSKEPSGTKGARITTHITLPGRYIVLTPFTDYVGISRRITDQAERMRLKQLAEQLKPKGMGVIIRTAAEGMSAQDFESDINFLLALFNKIQNQSKLGSAPKVIYKDMDLVERVVRDMLNKSTKNIIINNVEKYKSILELANMISPDLSSRIELFDMKQNIFQYFNIQPLINHILDRKVWLKSGGYIVIDETEALTSIDVNTGKYIGSINLEDTVLKTNMEAAKEIARQLRLRNISGIIIIDFIDMNYSEDEKLVLDCLEKELQKDRTKCTVLGMTQLGLVEMTRKKIRRRLASKTLTECPFCEGKGKVYSPSTIIGKIENKLKEMQKIKTLKNMTVLLNPLVRNSILEEYGEAINIIEKSYNARLNILESDKLGLNDIEIEVADFAMYR